MRDAADPDHGEHQGQWVPAQHVVDAGQAGTCHDGVEEVNRDERGQKARPEANVGPDLLGQVLDQAGAESRQQRQPQGEGKISADCAVTKCNRETSRQSHGDRHPADTWRWAGVELLGSAAGIVMRQMRVQPLKSHEQPAKRKRRHEGARQNQQQHERRSGM